MKHSSRNLLAGILVLTVISGMTTWSFLGQSGTATAGEKRNIKVVANVNEEKSDGLEVSALLRKMKDGLEVSALLRKMNMNVAPDRPLMPDFELFSLAGKKVRLSDFRGEAVLLGFFTTW
jgi:hypothetical protein